MSFCVNGSNFGPGQYYRDDDQALRLLKTSGANPVLLTGLRRIGKSWFLRRFEQIFTACSTRHFADDGAPSTRPLPLLPATELPRAMTVLDGGAEDLASALDAVIARADPSHVLAVDELEKLVADPDRGHLLDRILAYRPLVLTAAPVIHEIARARVPRLASFFEDRCVSMVLKPLSRGEKRALVLQTCDPGEGVREQSAAMALWWDWGGHPLVLQQIGVLLRDAPASDTAMLLNQAHARLNHGSPRYGVSLSSESGLSRGQRDVLSHVAAGRVPGDEPSAAVLLDHGAVVLRKGKWAIENCILRRHLQGASDAPAPVAAHPPPAVKPTKPVAPTRAFTWIHLSDLHFGAGTVGYRFDHTAVMRAIERDVARAPRPVDRIFITGDIAFSAQQKEYDEARKWIERIGGAAGVGMDRIRFVPGNHDVDRQVVKKSPLLRSMHYAVRQRGIELDDVLDDAAARAELAAKLASYQRFVSSFAGHPPQIDSGIDWVEVLTAGAAGHGPIRIAGLSSVWTSDDLDGRDEKGKGFVRNLMLAHGPLEQIAGEATDKELTFVLTHHPPEWIAPRADGVHLLSRELERLPHIHLLGHVHDAVAGVTTRHGHAGRSVWYVAGAAHSDPSEAAKHGYAWGALRHDPSSGGWQAGWAPRAYVNAQMCSDSTGRTLDDYGFAWQRLDCPWPAPTAVA